jgi:hypothetical protein
LELFVRCPGFRSLHMFSFVNYQYRILLSSGGHYFHSSAIGIVFYSQTADKSVEECLSGLYFCRTVTLLNLQLLTDRRVRYQSFSFEKYLKIINWSARTVLKLSFNGTRLENSRLRYCTINSYYDMKPDLGYRRVFFNKTSISRTCFYLNQSMRY